MSAYSGYTDAMGGASATEPARTTDASMSKATATEVWNSTFSGATSVTVTEFARGMARHFNTVYKQPLYSALPSTPVPPLMNAALAATGAFTPSPSPSSSSSSIASAPSSITRDAFLQFLARFGGGLNLYSLRELSTDAVKNVFDLSPLVLASEATSTILSATGGAPEEFGNLVSLVPWLHSSSDLPASTDSFILSSSQSSCGTFLLRWSGSRPAQLVLEFVPQLQTKVQKMLIERTPTGGWMKNGGKTVHPTLHALVRNHAQANGTWIRSELSKRFQGGENPDGEHPAGDAAAATGANGYSAGAVADQLSTMHVGSNSAYAAGPLATAPTPIVVPAGGGYAATFDPVAAAPAHAPAPSGYSASFVEADTPKNAITATASDDCAAPAPPSLLLPLSTRALFYACSIGDLCAVNEHLAACEGCALVDGWGLSALHVACANDQPEILKLLKSHVPAAFLRANVTTAISITDSLALSSYTWANRFLPYWPSTPLAAELNVCNPRALCMEFAGEKSACLALLDEWGVQPSLILERAPSAKRAPVAVVEECVPILSGEGGRAPTNSGYQAQ
jgi:hypothetical protein